MELRNPADDSLITTLQPDDAASISEKVARAHAAQPAWAARSISERATLIERFRHALTAEVDALAEVLSREMGKPVTQARGEIQGTGQRIAFFLQHLDAVAPEVVLEQPGLIERIEYEPLGVVANISAWNYPWFVGTNVIIPALLTGNAVIYKPSEHATMTGQAIARLLHDAGVPADVLPTLVGGGAVGAQLLNEALDGVFFTGSYETGTRIARAIAGRLITVQLELGGKDPAYVTEDVDVAAAARALAEGAFYNAGQSCCAVERIYVHSDIFDAFVDHFVEVVRGYRVGDPSDPTTFIGPLARRAQLTLLQSQVDDALEKGARLLMGGRRLEGPGAFFAPTVLVDVDHTMRLMTEESFGPVIGIQRVSGDAAAVELMEDTPYGLTAAVYTASRERAEAILRQLSTGSAYWNCCDRVSPRLPWSGRGHSGLGLTLSTHGIRAFTRPRAWHLRPC